MNWNHFLLLLTGAYLCYYMLNFLADLYLTKKLPATQHEQNVLFFAEDIEPELITYEEAPEANRVAGTPAGTEIPGLPSTALEFTGAVNLKELFRLAQQNLIEFTGAIPY